MTIVESIKKLAKALGVSDLEGETKAEAISNLADALEEKNAEDDNG